jgi:replicative DNA helicase
MSAIFDADPRDAVAALRVPPNSQEAEQSVLGGLLIDNNAWDRVADLLTEADFYRHEHKVIYTSMGRLIGSNRPADVVTVFDALGDKAEEVGGLAYLNSLAQSVPSAANCRRYAEIVRERSVLRQLLAKVDEAAQIVYEDGAAAEKVEKVQALFASIEARTRSRDPIGMDELMVRVMDGINAAAEGNSVAWRTGIPCFDRFMDGGMKPGELLILAARPSVGKTSLALQVARRVASDGYPALVLSQEMAAEQIGYRMLSSAARVDLSALRNGKMTDLQWGQTADGVDELAKLPMKVDEEGALTLRAIQSKARKLRDVKVIFVDYLQLCEGEGETRTARVGSVSRGLKALAKRMNCCVVALSQLNRAVEERPGKRPQLSDLRDSGEIEQDADVIAFLWPLGEQQGISKPVGLEVAKNRQAMTGTAVLEFFGATQQWGESTRSLDSFDTKKRTGGFE